MRAACLGELQALKPGNVHVQGAGHGMTLADFEASAAVAAAAMGEPGLSVGERILEAVRRTRQAVGCNTNLGIVLLCAPLCQAAHEAGPGDLRRRTTAVLEGLDVRDAELAFRAIRLAAPAGLGASPRHDVRAPARTGLRQAMAEARDRDRVAAQYAYGFEDVFARGLPCYRRSLARWGDAAWSAACVYLGYLAAFPDSHVTRKFGAAAAEALRRRAAPLEARLRAAPDPAALERALLDFDTALKGEGLNPGTSADLTVATLLAVRLEDALNRA